MVQIISGLITYLLLAIYCREQHNEKVSETFEKCSILVKEGKNFNHRNPAYSGIKYFED